MCASIELALGTTKFARTIDADGRSSAIVRINGRGLNEYRDTSIGTPPELMGFESTTNREVEALVELLSR